MRTVLIIAVVLVGVLVAYKLLRLLYDKRILSPFKIAIFMFLAYIFLEARAEETVLPWYAYVIMGLVALAVAVHTVIAAKLWTILSLPLNLAGGAAIAYGIVSMDGGLLKMVAFWGTPVLALLWWSWWGDPGKKEEEDSGPEGYVSLKDLPPALQQSILNNSRAMLHEGLNDGADRGGDYGRGYGSGVDSSEGGLNFEDMIWMGDDLYQTYDGRYFNSSGQQVYVEEDQ